jgi:hypothetical protein
LATVRAARTGPDETIPAITAITAITPVTRSRRDHGADETCTPGHGDQDGPGDRGGPRRRGRHVRPSRAMAGPPRERLVGERRLGSDKQSEDRTCHGNGSHSGVE